MVQDVAMTGAGTTPAPFHNGGEAPWAGMIARPETDIYEEGDNVVVVANLPGVGPDDVDITLESRTLTIRGRVQPPSPEGYRRVYTEHDVGGFERVFTLSQDIDRDRIEANLKNGVLTLKLPKAESAKTRKISVTAG